MKKKVQTISLIVLLILVGCKRENQPPTCEIISPVSGSTYMKGEIVTISVDASDEDGTISEVRFFLDGIGKFSTKAWPYNFDWDTGEAGQGNHLIKVVAFDDDNLKGEATMYITIEITIPTVITGEVKETTYNSAVCTGEIPDDKGSDITDRGICWSKNPNPDINKNHKSAGIGMGDFEVVLDNLEASTLYYVKAYAVNEFGDFYGEEISFESEEFYGDGSFIYDGREYQYKTIGYQTWMVENLAYLPAVSPSSSGSDSSPHYYVYGYEGSSVSSAKANDHYRDYGVLYNWKAAITACPVGWHLPSDEEWKTLEKHLGMSEPDANNTNWRESGAAGKKLKSVSGWYNNGNGDNTSRFSAYPGGGRSFDGGYSNLGKSTFFWTSSEEGLGDAMGRTLNYGTDGVFRGGSHRRNGFSVRCLHD